MTDKHLERVYTQEERDDALQRLVVIGNSATVSKQTGIPARTLRDWRDRYAERFYELSELHRKDSDTAATAKMRELAHKTVDAASHFVDRALDDLNAGKVGDAASGASKLMHAAHLAVDKTAVLEGRPTVIIQHNDYRSVLQKYGGYEVDGEAEEITSELPPTLE